MHTTQGYSVGWRQVNASLRKKRIMNTKMAKDAKQKRRPRRFCKKNLTRLRERAARHIGFSVQVSGLNFHPSYLR
jgi:hypothetical protein